MATQSHFLANPSQYLLSQLSQFGPVNTQANLANALQRSAAGGDGGAKSQNNPLQSSNEGNLELDELQVFSKKTANAPLKASSIMKASAFDAKAGASSITSLPTTNRNFGGDLSFKNEELKQEEQRQRHQALVVARRPDSVTDLLTASELQDEAQRKQIQGQQPSHRDDEINLRDIGGSQNEAVGRSTRSNNLDQQSLNASNNKKGATERGNRWLAGLDRSRSKNQDLERHPPTEDLDAQQKQALNMMQLENNSDEDCEEYFKSMEGLMTEKERLKQEQDKIRQNKFLKMVDRSNAIKSVRSLSRTIEDLISKEKEKISEHYQSKLEKSRASIMTQSRMMSSSV